MKRDIHKEMTEASNKYAQSVSDLAGEQSLLSIAFCEGVRWADRNPKDRAPEPLRTQMEYEDHRCDRTLYGQFRELLNTLGAMSGCSDYVHLSQQNKEDGSVFNVYLTINEEEGNIHIDLNLHKPTKE